MRRRDFITGIAGSAAAWPLAARAQQQSAMPVIGFVNAGSSDAPLAAAFRNGLNQAGYFESQNVTVEYHWLEGQFDRLPALMADLVRRRLSVIATPAGNFAARVAKDATTTIPIVFGVGEDPVKLGLVASLARPGGNLTGIIFLRLSWKRSGWHFCTSCCPRPFGSPCWSIRPMPRRPRARYTPSRTPPVQWDCKFRFSGPAPGARSRPPSPRSCATAPKPYSLLVTCSLRRRVQLATLAAINRIPTSYPSREAVEVGGLMGYAADRAEMYRQVGTYTGQILKGAKPADLPVLQSTKFEFVLNLQTARALGLIVPPMLLARADEVIE